MAAMHAKTVSILDILAGKGECELDELIVLCRRFGWCDIFREIDRLRREGHIRLVAKGCGVYVLSLEADAVPLAPCTEERIRNAQARSNAQPSVALGS
jgi:hypothetical protein